MLKQQKQEWQKRNLIVSFLLATSIFGITSLGIGQEKRTGVRIGVSISLSGPLGGLGQEAKAGMEYAVADINKTGGISVAEGSHLPVRLIVYDDKSDQTTSVGNFERLITVDKVDFLLGHVTTNIIVADAGIAERYGVPYLTAGTNFVDLHKGEAFKWTWVIFMRRDRQFVAAREVLHAVAPGVSKKVAFWKENSFLGETLEKVEAPITREAGWEVNIFSYTGGSRDFTDLLVKSKRADVSVIYGDPTAVDAIGMMRQMKELAYAPQAIFWPRGASVMQFRDGLGPDADYVADTVGWSPTLNYPGNRELSARYTKDTGRVAAAVLGPSYASAQVLFNAIGKAGSLKRTDVRDAIQKTDMTTVNGRLTFPAKGSPVLKVIVNQWQKGRYVPVWPSDVAEAKFLYPMPAWSQR